MEYPAVDQIRAIGEAAGYYAQDNYGNMVGNGRARRDESGTWHVQIVCSTRYGNLVIGQMLMDDAGTVLEAPSREDLDHAAKLILAKLDSVQLPEGRVLTAQERGKPPINKPRKSQRPNLAAAKAS